MRRSGTDGVSPSSVVKVIDRGEESAYPRVMAADEPTLRTLLHNLFRQEPLAGAEPQVESRVSESIANFLRAALVSSDIAFEALAEEFHSSIVPEKHGEIGDYLGKLTERVVAHSVNTSSPKYMGHMTSALPFFMRPLSRLITALNQNLVKVETAKALTPYEREALGMLHRLLYRRDDAFYATHLQQRDSTLGIVTSGGTLANMTALWVARNAALSGAEGRSVERVGVGAALRQHQISRAVVVGSQFMHYSLEKAADLLGLGTDALMRVAVTESGSVDVGAVRTAVGEAQRRGERVIAIVGIAGTTDTGAIDDLDGLADVARDAGAHFHVDAAWGGPLLFSSRHRPKLQGIDRADSVTIDGHKQLYLPMGIGTVLWRDPTIATVIEKQSPYIIRKDSHDLGRRALEGSRPGMALYLHAALHILGREGYEYLVDEGMRKAEHMAAAIEHHDEFELLAKPQINIVNYRLVPTALRPRVRAREAISVTDHATIDRLNVRLQEEQRSRGRTFVSRTTIRLSRYDVPVVALRAVLANPLTTTADIDQMLEEERALATELEAAGH
jgi:putative pyridoxal-dependent aspartate 1-decarboxylase